MERRHSEREKQITRLLLDGLTNKEIAAHLSISRKTVEFHLTRLYEVSGCQGRVQLALRVERDGLLWIDDSRLIMGQ